MKTIGQYLRTARKDKGLSLGDISAVTKIRREFLIAIEREDWEELPEFSSVVGFVKAVAGATNMNVEQAVALLRRDYPPKKVIVDTPKKDIPREFRWGPRLTFFLGIGAVVVLVVVYLMAQYIAFVRPPKLLVNEPLEGALVTKNEVLVSGVTDPSTTVIVNAQPALVDKNGSFSTTIIITENSDVIEITATSRAGKETRVTRTIKPELGG